MTIKINVELNGDELKSLVVEYLSNLLNTTLTIDDIKIETKSTQNYKAEWETAAFRARVEKVK